MSRPPYVDVFPEVELRFLRGVLQYRTVYHKFVDDGEESGIVDSSEGAWKTVDEVEPDGPSCNPSQQSTWPQKHPG